MQPVEALEENRYELVIENSQEGKYKNNFKGKRKNHLKIRDEIKISKHENVKNKDVKRFIEVGVIMKKGDKFTFNSE